PEKVEKIKQLNDFARKRQQTLAQMALAWCLRDKRVTSVIIGTSSVKQLSENIQTLDNLHFTEEELRLIGSSVCRIQKK
ncbi:MAG: L-glyceraldehyde 3-phosphate reductase, partial [Bacteroidales bacterium]|nr:L-glyceraldehyde 3-phosphate reductase [Bacteroidales bacterium]